MEFDAEIDAALDALSDCLSEELHFSEDKDYTISDVEEKDVLVDEYDPSQENWMKRFLRRTYEQNKNFEINLTEAEVVLKEIDKNVVDCQSKAKSVLENEDSVLKSTAGTNNVSDKASYEKIDEGDVVPVINDKSWKLVSDLHHEMKNSEDLNIELKKGETDKRILEFEASCEEEILHRIDDIEVKRIASEKNLQLLAEAERKILNDLNQQKLFYENERKNKAACLMQALFRRFCVRKIYGNTVDELRRNAKERRMLERIQNIEEMRKQQVSNASEEATVERIDTNPLTNNSLSLENNNPPQTADYLEEIVETSISDSVLIEKKNIATDPTFLTEDESNEEATLIQTNLESLKSASKGKSISESEFLIQNSESSSVLERSVFSSDEHEETTNDEFYRDQNNANDSEDRRPAIDRKNIPIVRDITSTQTTVSSQPLNDRTDCPEAKTHSSNDIADECGDEVLLCSSADKGDTNVMTMLKRDLQVLEQSVVLNNESGDDRVTKIHSSGNPEVLQPQNKAKNLLQTIDNDLMRLQVSVNLELASPPTQLYNDADFAQYGSIQNRTEVKKTPVESPEPALLNTSTKGSNAMETLVMTGHEQNLLENEKSPLQKCAIHKIDDNYDNATILEESLSSKANLSKSAFSKKENECKAPASEVNLVSPKSSLPSSAEDPSNSDEITSKGTDKSGDTQSVVADELISHNFNIAQPSPSMQSTMINHVVANNALEPTNESEIKNEKCATEIEEQHKDDEIPLEDFGESEIVLHNFEEKAAETPTTQPSSTFLSSSQETSTKPKSFNTNKTKNNPQAAPILDQLFCKTEDKSQVITSEFKSKSSSNDNPTLLWKMWKEQCTPWETDASKLMNKTNLKRAIRKSSAAKKLPPFSPEEIVKAKWPFHKDLVKDRSLEALSRIYISSVDDGVGRNLINIQRCSNLTHLTLVKCGLVSLEGMQACPSLRHIDVSCNSISVISCDNMKRLESLVASHNRLTSIHGLSGCNSMLLLDLAKNNITKITGLDALQNLAHLRLASNQLMNIHGLGVLNSLVSLDVSCNNLSSLDGIEKCGLLRFMNASNNCFRLIPAKHLTNLVLLVDLNLSDNSISNLHVTLDESQHLFLPLLTRLHMQQNKISFEEGLEYNSFSKSMPQLHELNLSQNLISDSDSVIDFFVSLSCLKQLHLQENLFSQQQEELIFEKCQEHKINVFFRNDVITTPSKTSGVINELLSLSYFPYSFPTTETSSDLFLNMASKQVNEYIDLAQREKKEIKNLRGWKLANLEKAAGKPIPPDMFHYHCDYLKLHSELAIQQRLIHEGKRMHFEKKFERETYSVDFEKETSVTHSEENISILDPVLKNNLFDKNLDVPQQGRIFEGRVEAINSPSDPRNEEFSRQNFFEIPLNSKVQSPLKVKSETVLHQPIQPTSPLKKISAIRIQRAWRNYVGRRNSEVRLNAAVVIQAAWRGHAVRRNLQKAFASFNTTSDVDLDDFEEIDLTQLEFDEKVYDQQWAVKTNKPVRILSTPPSVIPPPPTRSYSAGAAGKQFNKSVKPQTYDDSITPNVPVEMDDTQNLWQKIASFSKPPLPPITPTISDAETHITNDISSISDLDSHRSKHSRKDEVLANEWGLHNSSAVKLMLKRAKRMKGRKKKQTNADEKLRRFHDLKQKVAEKPMTSLRKPAQVPNRVEYFKAREMEFENREKRHSEDDEQRRQYTYEWLHARADISGTDGAPASHRGHPVLPHNSARCHQSESGSVKSGFLPVIPQQRSVMSSKQQNDLEVLSLSSHNSGQVRSKLLLRDIARRHGDRDIFDMKR